MCVSVFVCMIFVCSHFSSPANQSTLYKIMLSLSDIFSASNLLIFIIRNLLKKTRYTEKIYALFAFNPFWYLNSVPAWLNILSKLCAILFFFRIDMRLKMSLLEMDQKVNQHYIFNVNSLNCSLQFGYSPSNQWLM